MADSNLLATTQSLKLGPTVTHVFATTSESSCNLLQDVVHTTDHLANSLGQYLAMPWTNQKLVSLLRQHAATLHTLHLSDQNIHTTIDGLRERSGVQYGEDIPLDRVALVDWCITRFESWGSASGMETFKDESGDGKINLILGGKVLVVDVDFAVDKTNPLWPIISVASVKTSYAIQNAEPGSSNADGSISLDGFLTESMRRFCEQVQKDEASQDPLEAGRLGAIIFSQLKYLVTLDRLAHRRDDGGIRWFVDIDQLCTILEGFAKNESQAISASLKVPAVPLDIFLHRSHSLPLPYLTFPSISFLTYLSPRAYLSLLRSVPTDSQVDTSPTLPEIDVPFPHLRSWLSKPREGVTIAILKLSPPVSPLFPPAMSMPTLTSRPTFYLVPAGNELEHVLPQTADLSVSTEPPTNENGTLADQHTWTLDFTDGGKTRGVVLSQSRMRDVELVVNPFSGIEDFSQVSIMSFGERSWVDLLLNPTSQFSAERYSALYESPTGLHPPLHLRLTSPEEPGFFLEQVPVHSMKEVWGILEVVREQCWLNELLLSCQWTTDVVEPGTRKTPPEKSEVTDADLDALLSGNSVPRKIPVNVWLPSSATTAAPLLDATEAETISHIQSRRPRILMASPERSPATGLVGIAVTYDETRPKVITVQVTGAMGADLQSETMEEICRRGGTLGLPGRIWAKSRGL